MSDQVFVPKGWGFEKWITNNELYCGKILYFVKGKECSWHFHEVKDEVLYVQSGSIVLKFSDDDSILGADEIVLERGDSFRIRPKLRHQMFALEDTEIFEISTTHFDEDSIRLLKGD